MKNRIGTSFVLGLFWVGVAFAAQTSMILNERPIIGILAQEVQEVNGDNRNNSYIAASYVKYLEGAGAQVVPILINQTEIYVKKIFSSINGLLIPGGSIYFPSSFGSGGFVETGRQLLRLAREANDKGDFFPVWGTCLGFEFLIFDEADGKEVRASCGAWNVADKLKYTKETTSSRLFSSAPKSVVRSLATSPISVNFHHFCVTPQNFTKFGLDKKYMALSINYDNASNLTYISAIEHRNYPFWGVQFHPEKNIYEWTTKENIPHSADAIKSAQFFANFFVEQAKQNIHKFSSLEDETRSLIYNYSPIFTGAQGSTFIQKYFF